MRLSGLKSDILRYIVENGFRPGDLLPTIQSISRSLDASVARIRESLEVARALGVVEVRPGRGTRVAAFTFAPIASLSALYAIGQDAANFDHLREMRNALEIYFWPAAVSQLGPDDLAYLRTLIRSAREQLASQPVQVPAEAHRRFHLALFARLENPFVQGILEAFWQAYEAFGLNQYFDIAYHRQVWDYHERIVSALESGDIEHGRRLLSEHMGLLQQRGLPADSPRRPALDPRLSGFE